MTSDGLPEIKSLAYLGFEFDFALPSAGLTAGTGARRAPPSGFSQWRPGVGAVRTYTTLATI